MYDTFRLSLHAAQTSGGQMQKPLLTTNRRMLHAVCTTETLAEDLTLSPKALNI